MPFFGGERCVGGGGTKVSNMVEVRFRGSKGIRDEKERDL